MLLAFLVLTAIAIVRLTDLFAVVMLMGIYSLVSACLFVVMDAVDVAFTEAAVGAGISTLLMLTTLTITTRMPAFYLWLGKEIVLSNIDVLKRVWSPDNAISPTLVRVKADQETDIGKVIYGNSITLTPGTVTLDVGDGEMLVHALTKEGAETLLTDDMGSRIKRIE